MSVRAGSLTSLFEQGNGIRAGVLPYSMMNGRIYWLMGRSRHYTWSDFGGGCRKIETPHACLLREVAEETNDLLTEEIEASIARGNGIQVYTAYDKQGRVNDHLLLLPIPFRDYEADFTPNFEISNLTWIPEAAVLNPHLPLRLFHSPLMRFIAHLREVNAGPR